MTILCLSSWSLSALDFQHFSALGGKLLGRFASGCSTFGHGGLGEPTLIHGPRVARELGEARVPGNGPDLVWGAPSLSQAARRSLAQTVGRAMR